MLGMFIALAAATGLQGSQPAPDSKDPVVCHREESEVGTHLRPKKVCLRQSEWDYMEEHTKEKLQSLNSRGSNPVQIPPGPARPQ